jgi:hypothetical protein
MNSNGNRHESDRVANQRAGIEILSAFFRQETRQGRKTQDHDEIVRLVGFDLGDRQ